MFIIHKNIVLLVLLFLAIAVQAEDDGKHTGIKGGGGDSAVGNGRWGDKPPMTTELFPDRSGFKSKAKIKGDGDSSKPYTPPRHFIANADFPMAKRFQAVDPRKFSKHSPAAYYASASRDEYPGAWGHGFYLVYPYPWWAYGVGSQMGPTYYCNKTVTSFYDYKPQLRNITVLNDTNVPLVGDYDIFNIGKSAGFKDYNNGTVEITPCADASSSELGVADNDCTSIVLDLVQGSVVSGNAKAEMQSEFTMFKLKLGSKEATLRTVTIASTHSKVTGNGIAGVVLMSLFLGIPAALIVFACLLLTLVKLKAVSPSVALAIMSPKWCCCKKRRFTSNV